MKKSNLIKLALVVGLVFGLEQNSSFAGGYSTTCPDSFSGENGSFCSHQVPMYTSFGYNAASQSSLGCGITYLGDYCGNSSANPGGNE
jgi:hypothetical protein